MTAGTDSLEVLHRDDDWIAVNKPPGLFVHANPREPRCTPNAVAILARQIGQRVLPVHRLDRPTSGVLLFALHSEAARQIAEAFKQRLVEKEYLAIVRGHTDDSGVIEKPLQRHTDGLDDPEWESARSVLPAVTGYEPPSRSEIPFSAGRFPTSRYSLVRVFPKTGRRHQIRRHFNHIAHPVLGDTRHGDHRHNKLVWREFGLMRMMLAATRLTIRIGESESSLMITARPGDEFERAIALLGLNPERTRPS